jgi:predicted acetyltransferase
MIHNTHLYTYQNIPQTIKSQILSFLKQQWPDSFKGINNKRDWIVEEEYNPRYFVITDNNDNLISHTAVVYKNLKHQNKTFKTYGLSGVFTTPPFRRKGYALTLLKKAKEYIENTTGDIVLFHSMQDGFYEKAGFEYMANTKLLKGNANNPIADIERVYMLFLSEKAKLARKDFETHPIYFGEEIW